ncbi:acyl-CoA synthetase [Thalassovita taeanensis]|uniref:3-methylmercaptopropionyl-CoA ligase n=1 Tax=Thalassovita taeanensis TaxID=657014 RepID=A0A1H9AVC2_9RHOB|nr:acyl-CoA synthetase [Thalassovita taeanensis]SEP80363.1 fatty-acyl-CoA synthase [Thalassovita taeanensis]
MTQTLGRQIGIARQHTIGDLLRRSARKVGDKTAIICGEVSWTYAELDALCNRLARGLMERGIGIGDRVAIVSRNSHAFAAMRFAIARAGAVLVPVNFMLNADEIGFILRSSGARAVAFGPEFAAIAAEAMAKDTAVEWTLGLPGEALPAAPADVSFDALGTEDDSAVLLGLEGEMLAQIVYTSGTESAPKGAMLTHSSVMWQYVSCIVDGEMTSSDVMLHALPMYHCAQLDVFVGPAIYLGMTSVITGQPSPDVILPLLEKHGISSFFCPPSVWISLLRSPLLETTDLSKLAKGYYGASIMPVEVLKEMQARLPQVRLWNFYGQTEIAPVATVLPPEEQLSKPGSAGFPALNVETRVVDDLMNDVAVGEVGEIVHRSPQLMTGYFNDPVKTAAAFEGGWFHSGDLGCVDKDGYIAVVDRKKDMINTGGENVSSREVEEVIYLLPQVSEVAVIGLPHERWIEQVTAVIVLKSGHSAEVEHVMAHCREVLAHFKVPKRVEFIDTLPKNPSGKILKRDLRIAFGSSGSAVS